MRSNCIHAVFACSSVNCPVRCLSPMALANSVTHHAADASSWVQSAYHLTTSAVLPSLVHRATSTPVSTYNISSAPLGAIVPSLTYPWAGSCCHGPVPAQTLCGSTESVAGSVRHQHPDGLVAGRLLWRQFGAHSQPGCARQGCFPIWQFAGSSCSVWIYVEV